MPAALRRFQTRGWYEASRHTLYHRTNFRQGRPVAIGIRAAGRASTRCRDTVDLAARLQRQSQRVRRGAAPRARWRRAAAAGAGDRRHGPGGALTGVIFTSHYDTNDSAGGPDAEAPPSGEGIEPSGRGGQGAADARASEPVGSWPIRSHAADVESAGVGPRRAGDRPPQVMENAAGRPARQALGRERRGTHSETRWTPSRRPRRRLRRGDAGDGKTVRPPGGPTGPSARRHH